MALNWLYGGVDATLEGNGGPECATYLSLWRRSVESLCVCSSAIFYMKWGYDRIHVPKTLRKDVEQRDRFGKRFLLVLMCLTFGCEIGFKLATKTVIYLLNPCHVVTILQIYLLASPPTPMVTIVFRFHLHFINGAFLALAFPVLNTRLLPMEKEIYFIQHVTMVIIPFYLLRIGGVYTLERLADFSWAVMSLGGMLIYHFVILQCLGMMIEVNLNNMLCPAVSDPFRGMNYRIWATGHQSLLICCLGKLYFQISKFILRLIGYTASLHHPEDFTRGEALLERFDNVSTAANSTGSSIEVLQEDSDNCKSESKQRDSPSRNNAKVAKEVATPEVLKNSMNSASFASPRNSMILKISDGLKTSVPAVTRTEQDMKAANGKADHVD